jgi:cytochrome bd-type quinol oxidase subunit 2
MIEKFIKPVYALIDPDPVDRGVGSDIYNPVLSPKIKALGGSEYLALLVKNLLTLFLIITAVVALFMLIIGGIRWMTSSGDKAKMEGARSQITQALIGLVIVFCSFAIITLVGNFFGIQLLEFDLSPLFLR